MPSAAVAGPSYHQAACATASVNMQQSVFSLMNVQYEDLTDDTSLPA